MIEILDLKMGECSCCKNKKQVFTLKVKEFELEICLDDLQNLNHVVVEKIADHCI